MRTGQEDWQLTYLRNKALRYAVVVLFAGFNVVSLVMSALPADSGTIPRRYWPLSILAVVAVGLVYWSAFPLLRQKIGKNGRSLGQRVGIEVLYDNEDSQIDRRLEPAQQEALKDVNRRRAGYRVRHLLPLHRLW